MNPTSEAMSDVRTYMAAKHTPGPWEHVKAERLSHDAPEIGPIVSEGGILGGSPDDPVWVIEGEIEFAPDARLIAAAPDLLAALKAIKAHGELANVAAHNGRIGPSGKKPPSKDVWQIPRHMLADIESAIAKATGA